MSSYDTPEIASIYGALDSTTFADGRSVDAHVVRTVTANANRLAAKVDHITSMPWTVRISTADMDGNERWAPTTHWTKVLPKIAVKYRRGLRTAGLRISARILEDSTIWMQVATKSQPFARGATTSGTNTIELTGDGDDDVDTYSKAGILLDPSGEDELDVRILGIETVIAADETTGGAPNNRAAIVDPTNYETNNFGHDGAGTWILNGYAFAGTEVRFAIGGGQFIRRIITGSNDAGDTLFFAPDLASSDLALVVAEDDWELFRLPTIGLVSLTIDPEQRSV